jgi:hypothetical protein
VDPPRYGSAARKEAPVHGRIARYGYTGDPHDMARRVEDGLLPLLQSQPGFKAYSVAFTEGEIFSFSAWESAANAESANAVAADWVAENLADEVSLKEAHIAEILIGTAIGVSTKAGATA